MAYVDFVNDCTEIDPDSEIDVTTNLISTNATDYDAGAYVYYDGGASHFGTTLTHQFEFTINNFENVGLNSCYALSNSNSASFGSKDIFVSCDGGGSTYVILIFLWDWSDYDVSAELDIGTKYFITVERNATPNTILTIRTGSHTGSVVDTLTITDDGSSFRYLYPFAEYTE